MRIKFLFLVTILGVLLIPSFASAGTDYRLGEGDPICVLTIDAKVHTRIDRSAEPVQIKETEPNSGCFDDTGIGIMYGWYDTLNKEFVVNGAAPGNNVQDGDILRFVNGSVLIKLKNNPNKQPEKPVEKPEKDGFVDVKKGDTHYDGIMYWSKKGVIKGYPRKKDKYMEFKPNEKLKRMHTSVLFDRAFQLGNPSDISAILSNYHDIDPTHMYAKEIASTYESNFFIGSNGYFMPVNSLTREQMATVLVRAFKLDEVKVNGNFVVNMKDVDPSHQRNVQILADTRVTKEISNFRPKESVTRGQFATFMYRAVQVADN